MEGAEIWRGGSRDLERRSRDLERRSRDLGRRSRDRERRKRRARRRFHAESAESRDFLSCCTMLMRHGQGRRSYSE
jgi:hypothetical protein